ncbi:MAG: preprotein translocase subunit YajC [Thermoanaerobaculia bacterium]
MTPVAYLQAAGGASALFWNVVPILAIFAIFYFLVIAPANRQRKKTQQMLEALKKGDRIVTSGGIHGTIQSVEPDIVYVKVADNVKLKLSRSAVAAVVDGSSQQD